MARRSGLVAAACFGFALGSGVGAYIATADYGAAPAVEAVVYGVRDAEGEPSLGRSEQDAGLERLAASDVHEAPRALTIDMARARLVASQAAGPEAAATAVAAAALPALAPGQRLQAPVTYYHCQGAGGGFCGQTADGSQVQVGLAACAAAYLGQVFRVVGDPSGLVFRCADTGSGVQGQLRDVWFPDAASGAAWFAHVGPHPTIEILE